MPLDRRQTDLLLADLERLVRARAPWRDDRSFQLALEYELLPILETAADPGHVRAWVRSMLARNGYVDSAAALAATGRAGPESAVEADATTARDGVDMRPLADEIG